MSELRILAKSLGIPYSNSNKAQLIEKILEFEGSDDAAPVRDTVSAGHGADQGKLGTSHPVPKAIPSPLWQRIVAALAALYILGLVSFLMIRNQPFTDPVFPIALRTLLSLSASVLVATVPGFLTLNVTVRGLYVRAGGALAVFVLTYLYGPNVIPNGNLLTKSQAISISYQNSIDLLEQAIESGNWEDVHSRILDKDVTWRGFVVSSKSPGYIIKPTEVHPLRERQLAYVTLLNPKTHPAYNVGEPITISGTVAKFDNSGIDIVGATIR